MKTIIQLIQSVRKALESSACLTLLRQIIGRSFFSNEVIQDRRSLASEYYRTFSSQSLLLHVARLRFSRVSVLEAKLRKVILSIQSLAL